MKYNSITSSSLLLSLLLTVAGAQAQTESRANVPFAFKVGAKQMPAGSYTVETEISTNIVKIHNVATGASAMAVGRRESPSEKTNKLIFHRYGSHYFLTAILGTAGSDGMVLPASRQEKQLQEVAQAAAKSTNNVEIASK